MQRKHRLTDPLTHNKCAKREQFNVTNYKGLDSLLTKPNVSIKEAVLTILDAWGWCTGTEGWYGEGGGRRVQDGEHMYTCGGFISILAKPVQYCKV